jgi:selenocysteine lyase/cysteine desulfurase
MEEGPYVVAFDTPGTYEYICAIHAIVMKGTIVVQEAGAALPSDAAAYETAAQAEFAAQIEIGMAAIAEHERAITRYTLDALATVPDVRVIGPADLTERAATISLVVDGVHPHDVGQILDSEGVEVRVGHHCARPVCVRYGVPATTRVSPYLYTTTGDIDALVRGLYAVRKVFG